MRTSSVDVLSQKAPMARRPLYVEDQESEASEPVKAGGANQFKPWPGEMGAARASEASGGAASLH